MRAVAVVALSMFLASCAEPPAPPPPPGAMETTGAVVATVDGQQVTQDMIDAVTRRFPADQLEQLKGNPAQYKEFLDQVVLGQALYKRALDAKLPEDPEIRRVIAMADREALASALIEKVAKEAVTEEAIKAAYDKHGVQYNRPSLKLQHMILSDKAKAEDLATQLRAGGDFAALAKANSVDGGGQTGDGELGWVEKGRLIPELETPAFAGKTGELVGPIETSHGFHLIKINDSRAATPIEDVRATLEEEVKRDAVDAYIKELKESAKIDYAGDAKPADPAAPGAPAVPGEAPLAIPVPPPAGN